MTTTVSVSDFIDPLSWREGNLATQKGTLYQLVFSVASSGPSVGPIQLDWAHNSFAETMMSNILSADGFSAAQISRFYNAALIAGRTAGNAQAKQNAFALYIGQGDVAAGTAVINQVNSLLEENSSYVNAQSSAQADHVRNQINAYFQAIGYIGTPDPDDVALLAELANQIGNLTWLESYNAVTTAWTTNTGIVAAIKTAAESADNADAIRIFDDQNGDYSQTIADNWFTNYLDSLDNSSGDGNWYVPTAEQSNYSPITSSITEPTLSQIINNLQNGADPVSEFTWNTLVQKGVVPHFEPLVINLQ